MEAFRIKLDNGMTVLLKPDNSTPVVCIQLWVKTGSVHEADNTAGISHFVEHMLFKGTEHMSLKDISRIIEDSGGEINAYTSFEQTTVHVVLAGRYWENGLDVVSELVLNPIFPSDGFEIEKKVILEEIREGEDNPEVLLSQKLFAESYRQVNYRRPVIGYKETVSKIEIEDLKDYFTKRYVPNNMVMSITGSFDYKRAIEKINVVFGSRPYSPLRDAFVAEDSPPRGFNYSFINKGDSDTVFDFSFPIPGANHPDMAALDVLSTILGDGESSRLYQGLVIGGNLAREASSCTFSPYGPGLFLARVVPFKGAFKESFRKTAQIIWDLAHRDVSRHEMERARASIEKDLIFQEETVFGQARKLAYYETVYGDSDVEKKYLGAVRSVSKNDIKAAALKYLKPTYLTCVALFPKEGDVILENEAKAILDLSYKAKKEIRDFNGIGIRHKKGSELRESRTNNGSRLIVKNNPSSHLVSLTAIAPGGVRSENLADNGVSNLLSNLVQKGTKTRSLTDIANEITLLGGYTESFVGKNSFGYKMDVVGKNFDDALDLYFDMLLNATFPERYLQSEKKRVLEEIESLKDNFDSYGFCEFLKSMYGSHPYSLNSLGTKESIERIDRDLVVKKYERTLDPENMIFSVAGPVGKKIQDKIERKVGELKRIEMNCFENVPIGAIDEPIEKFEKVKSENAYLHFGFRGTRITSHDRYPLEIVNAALSNLGEGKLFIHLREKMGLAYSIFSTVFHGIEDGYFVIYMSTDPKNVEKGISEIKKVIEKLREDGLKDTDLARIKNYLVGSYEIELQRNSNQSVSLALNKLYGLPLDFKAYSEDIMAVNIDSVNTAIRKYLDLNKYVLCALLPNK